MYKVYRDVENEELFVRVNFSPWVTLADDFIDEGGPALKVVDEGQKLYLIDFDDDGESHRIELRELHTFINGQTQLLERFIHNDGEF